MTLHAYLDSEGAVVSTAKADHPVAVIQGKMPSAVTKITGAPDSLLVLCCLDNYHKKTSGDGTDINHYTLTESPLALQKAKDQRYLAIDMVSGLVIRQGFAHNGEVFSLSPLAQTNWSEMWMQKDSDLYTYPLEISTLVEGVPYDIADAAEVDTFYRAGYTKVRDSLDEGRQLKGLVEQETTIAGVASVVDSRLS